MTYELFIGDRAFSSWSLRGWLMFEKFGLPARVRMVGLYRGTLALDLAGLEPARTVPVMRTPEGHVIGDSLAMAETLAERHPEAGLWPADPDARGLARWLVAEMHASFDALRGECPMQLMRAYRGFSPSGAVRADLDRIEALWALARDRFGGQGPWLFGSYSLADVFYAPVAARITGYGLRVAGPAARYVQHHMADPAFRAWRDDGLAVRYAPEPYLLDLPSGPWPKRARTANSRPLPA